MSPVVLAVLAAVVLLAAFVQGSTGMGFAMVAAPVVGIVDPGMVPVLLLVLMVPLNAYVSWRERHMLDWRGVSWITVGRFAGTFLGLWILVVISANHLALLIGWSTLFAAVVALVAPAFTPGRRALVAVGLVTGVTETSTGIGGPPLALAYQHQPGAVLRSTVAMCFLIGELISLVVLGVTGNITGSQLGLSALLLPALVVGALASRWVHHRLDGTVMRLLVLGFAIVSGVVVIVQA